MVRFQRGQPPRTACLTTLMARRPILGSLTIVALVVLAADLFPRLSAWIGYTSAPQLRGRPLRAGKGLDSGEFDFGDFEAPQGVSVEEAEEVEGPQLAPPEAEVFATRETGEWKCGNCGYTYKEFWGAGSAAPGTAFKDVPANWRCPDCKVSKDQFTPVIEDIAGFVDNQDYGLGFNTMTAQQKGYVIWGGLGALLALLLSGYAMD